MSDRAQKLGIYEPEVIRAGLSEGNHHGTPGGDRDDDSFGNGGTRFDGETVEQLYRAHFDQMVRLSRVRIGNATDAEDLVQEAFTAVRRAYPNKSGEELRRLLFVTVRNLTVNFLKSGYRRQLRASVGIGGVGEGLACVRSLTPEKQLMDAQLLKVAEAVIARLPERRRTALRLHRYDGLTYDEIARRLSCSVRTVKSEVASGLAEIAEHLARAEGQSG